MTVAGDELELNAENGEVIIGTVIKEANNWKIDLNGFSTFWTFVKESVQLTLREYEKELEPTKAVCEAGDDGYTCTSCVCDIRNNAVKEDLENVKEVR